MLKTTYPVALVLYCLPGLCQRTLSENLVITEPSVLSIEISIHEFQDGQVCLRVIDSTVMVKLYYF